MSWQAAIAAGSGTLAYRIAATATAIMPRAVATIAVVVATTATASAAALCRVGLEGGVDVGSGAIAPGTFGTAAFLLWLVIWGLAAAPLPF